MESKAWYKSKTIQGLVVALLSMGGPMAMKWWTQGIPPTPEEMTALFGLVVAAYGRAVATTTIAPSVK